MTLGMMYVPIKERIMKLLRALRMERCIGCHSCSLACARMVHQTLSWERAGIRIHSAGGLSTGFTAQVCLGCNPAPCAAVCPTGALTQRKGGGVIFKKKKCIGCEECVPACPVEAILMDRATGLPIMCIHCGRCVAFCPHDCLEMVDTDKEHGKDNIDQQENRDLEGETS
jgi:Fe-S-cluster-containing hydrogenase component 2